MVYYSTKSRPFCAGCTRVCREFEAVVPLNLSSPIRFGRVDDEFEAVVGLCKFSACGGEYCVNLVFEWNLLFMVRGFFDFLKCLFLYIGLKALLLVRDFCFLQLEASLFFVLWLSFL